MCWCEDLKAIFWWLIPAHQTRTTMSLSMSNTLRNTVRRAATRQFSSAASRSSGSNANNAAILTGIATLGGLVYYNQQVRFEPCIGGFPMNRANLSYDSYNPFGSKAPVLTQVVYLPNMATDGNFKDSARTK